MVKFMGVIRLKPGYDPDETWELWRTEHATNFKNLARPELKQYTINRVIKRLNNNDIYGISESVFENVESCERALKRFIDAPADEVLKRFQPDRLIVEFEEIALD
ncbi:MAG: hypothetical protein ABIK32_01685 [Chloroflexota bacterium]|nr:hypothetical protein [Chloroflexota bacterium]